MEDAKKYQKFARVIPEVGVDKALDYGILSADEPKISPGVQVEMPIRGRLCKGIVLDVLDHCSYPRVESIKGILGDGPLLPSPLFALAKWMSSYYLTPLGKVLKAMLPKVVRNQMAAKEQLFVKRGLSYAQLRDQCSALQRNHPAQAKILEALLETKEGLFLTELLEKTGLSRSPVETLAKQKMVLLEKVRIDRSPLMDAYYFKTKPKELNEEQKEAFDKICGSLDSGTFQTHLIYGVTGSGKTEIYLQAIERALAKNKSALMLVPEIALTAQTCEQLLSRFEKKIAILHHRLSDGERADSWEKMRKKEVSIVVGARSALFSPLPDLGLIIIDEEQDAAYKQQEDSFCYHARDCAVMLGKLSSATVILGSATPSFESFENARQGKYLLSTLTKRPKAGSLPAIHIVDMKKEFEKAGGYTSFSAPLIDSLKRCHERGEQAIFFLNRRGYHTSLSCKTCGFTFKCPHCDVSLTFHRKADQLSCHLCDYRLTSFSHCPSCQTKTDMQFRGVGTEQIERAILALLPELRVLRIDGDTTKHKGSHDKLFRQFSTQKADLLIGTQMIAKGLHFPGVTLVAVLNSDSGLHIPDFRASEQIFQLIVQVAGRAGRGELPGEVFIQTHLPENSTIRLASKQNFEDFFDEEIEVRRTFGYPPFTHFTKLLFTGEDAQIVERSGQTFREALRKQAKEIVVHPLVPSGHAKIKDRYRFHFLLRGVSISKIHEAIRRTYRLVPLPKGVRLRIDVDPLSTFF